MALFLTCGLNNQDPTSCYCWLFILCFCFRAVLCDGEWRLKAVRSCGLHEPEEVWLDGQSRGIFFLLGASLVLIVIPHGIACHRCCPSTWCKWLISVVMLWHWLWLSSKGSLSLRPPSCLTVHGAHRLQTFTSATHASTGNWGKAINVF